MGEWRIFFVYLLSDSTIFPTRQERMLVQRPHTSCRHIVNGRRRWSIEKLEEKKMKMNTDKMRNYEK